MGAQFHNLPDAKEMRQAETRTVTAKSASATLGLDETVVKVTLPTGATNVTLTLPAVGAAKGFQFLIWVGTKTGTGKCIIQDQDDKANGSNFYHEINNALEIALIENVGGRFWRVAGGVNDLRVAKVPLAASGDTTVGAVFAWRNLTGVPVLVEALVVNITDAAAEGETFDAGVDDANDTSSDTLIDGGALNALAALCNGTNAGTNGKSKVVVPSTHYVTATASGSFTGLAGTAYIFYRPIC